MNRPTVFLKGPENAHIQNVPVVMMTTTRLRGWHYHFNYFLLTDDPNSLSEEELIRQYVQHLEKISDYNQSFICGAIGVGNIPGSQNMKSYG